MIATRLGLRTRHGAGAMDGASATSAGAGAGAGDCRGAEAGSEPAGTRSAGRQPLGPIGWPVWRLAWVIVFGAFMSGLDASVVNVGLDTIARDLAAGLGLAQWVANGYLWPCRSVGIFRQQLPWWPRLVDEFRRCNWPPPRLARTTRSRPHGP